MNKRPGGFWPAAHGHAASLGRLVASEAKPADELRPASPADTDRSDRTSDGRFARGNTAAKSKRLRAGLRGALTALEQEGDPAWQAAVKWGRRYGAHARLARAELEKLDARLIVVRAGVASVETELARTARATSG